MKYTLELTDKDPANNMTIHCKDSKEAVEYKRKAIEQGYKVKVKGGEAWETLKKINVE